MEHEKQTVKQEKPILVVDKEGNFGIPIAKKFARKYVTVLVSANPPPKTQNLIYVPYKKQIPRIPNSAFSFFYLIYSGDTRLIDFLPSFVKKAKEDKTHIFILIKLRDATSALIQKLQAYGSVISILLTGDMLGEGEWQNPVTDILTSAKSGRVRLPGMGGYPLFPVATEDLLGVVFATSQKKEAAITRIIYVLPSHPVTAVSFARLLLKTEPLLKIDFSENQAPRLAVELPVYQSVFGQNYPLEQKIPAWNINTKAEQSPLRKTKRRLIPRPRIKGATVVIFLLVCTIILGIVSPLIFSGIAAGLLVRAQTHIKNGDMITARSSAVAARQYFGLARQSDSLLLELLQMSRLEEHAESLASNIETGNALAQLAIDGIDGFTVLKKVFNGKTINPKADFQQGLNSIRYALTGLRTLQAQNKIPKQYENRVRQIEYDTSPLINIVDVLPLLFGMEGKRTYLVLFQNNMELRPGGGFIGSYALATVENAQMKEVKIQDVYDADGQLKDHIEPPYQLRRYLGSQHWFLRDSNFDVDFPNNAAMAGYFFNLEMGKKVDGIIAIDTSFVRSLLQVLGPVKLAEYNETITAENFFERTESHAQKNFFPGSTRKKDFLASVYDTLFLRLTESKNLPYDKLLIGVGNNIRQKHLLFGFPDPGLQKLFSINGLSSSLADARSAKPNTVNDFFGINEANLGQNKSNFYLNRSISHKVVLGTDGIASETATIQYQNKSKATDEFGGDYKAYIRIIVPAGSKLAAIAIDNATIPTVDAVTNPAIFASQIFRPPLQLEVERTEQNGKTIFGFMTIISAGTKKTISVTYTVDMKRAVNTPMIEYNLKTFKQPGTEADPYMVNIEYPAVYKVLASGNTGKKDDGVITYLSDMSQDREFQARLTKK